MQWNGKKIRCVQSLPLDWWYRGPRTPKLSSYTWPFSWWLLSGPPEAQGHIHVFGHSWLGSWRSPAMNSGLMLTVELFFSQWGLKSSLKRLFSCLAPGTAKLSATCEPHFFQDCLRHLHATFKVEADSQCQRVIAGRQKDKLASAGPTYPDVRCYKPNARERKASGVVAGFPCHVQPSVL